MSTTTLTHRQEREHWSRTRAVTAVALALAGLAAGSITFWVYAPDVDIVDRQLAGRLQELPPPPGTIDALWWNFVFIAGYGVALWLGTTAAGRVFWSEHGRKAAHFGVLATGAAVVVAVAENALLLAGLEMDPPKLWLLDLASAAATIKYAALLPAALIAVAGTLTTLQRALAGWDRASGKDRQEALANARFHTAGSLSEEPEEQAPPADAATRDADLAPSGQESAADSRWRKGFSVPMPPDRHRPGEANAPGQDDPPHVTTGFCLSGGGIRSASVAMGALQTLRPELLEADYLVSVSGGGYTSGALVQALTDSGDENVKDVGTARRDPARVYAPGSAEFDYLRRHSSYIAPTPTHMLVALGVLARGTLATLALLFAPAVVLGTVTAWTYGHIPLAQLPLLPDASAGSENTAGVETTQIPTAAFTVWPGSWIALGTLAVLAATWWLVHVLSCSRRARPRSARFTRSASVFLTQLGLLVAAVTIAVPLVVWAAGQTIAAIEGAGVPNGVAVGGPAGTVLLTYLASLATVLWRKRAKVKKGILGLGKRESATAAVPTGLLQLLLVLVTLAALVSAWLLLFGLAALATATEQSDGVGSSLWVAVGLSALVLVLGVLIDETSLSLHPFYRGRLASAFASRVVSPHDEPEDATVAVPYQPTELTALSTYGRAADGDHFPKVIFAGAASLTGEGRTPVGLNAVSFTMDADWVGGPDVGWVKTEDLERLATFRIQRDLTVQAAVAISGAAFASAMGRMARWYQILLAVSGARLGTWLPNPAYLRRLKEARSGTTPDWTMPPLPTIRRLPYLLRELFNLHPYEERLLQVTDGGHYENLGLVELLRRRCRLIYCIDAGGDRPPTAKGLAYALALAETELGVKVTLDHPLRAEPGMGTKLEPKDTLETLNAALASDPVITGTITYPSASGLPEGSRTGTLVVARALLWPTMPYPLLSYATQHSVFPHDSTGDQWFNDGQFTAYTQLGRALGQKVYDAKLHKERHHPVVAAKAVVAEAQRVTKAAVTSDGS